MDLPGFGTLILIFLVTFLVTLWMKSRGQSKLPPGPTPLPLLGNLLQIDFRNIVQEFVKLGSSYGPVSMVHLGSQKVLVLNGYEVVREAFIDNGEAFNDRAKLAIAEIAFQGRGIIFSNGERWKQLRRFTLSTLRNFGMGKRSLEERVQEEAKCLAEEFQKKKGAPFDPTFLLSLAVSNVFCTIFFNERFDYEDKDFLQMLALMKETFEIVTSPWAQFWNQYGSVYTLYFGSNPSIFICGYEAVKEALVDQNDDFGARGNVPTMDQYAKGYGLTFSNGERWKVMRSFTIKTLKDFGFGKKSIECKIQEEARCVMEEFRKSQGRPWNTTKLLMQATSNILCSILFGNRCDYSDERFLKILHNVEQIFLLLSCTWGQFQNILPGLMNHVPGPHRNVIPISEEIVRSIEEIVKSCQETLDPSDPSHFTDCFLIRIGKEKNNPNTEFTMDNLLHVIYNLFLAATETIVTTLRHAMLICLKYPDIEDKLRDEIDRVIGRDRMPNMEDRLIMPYMQAIICEVQRFSDIAPISLTHKVTKDTKFRGYDIPKGMDVYTLLCTIHRDPTQFATPYKFNPNHFLDENGKFKKNDACMPFSAGKRMCPGDHVARMELFIFLASILQNFTLSSDREFTEAEVAPKLEGFLNTPIQYELSFNPR